MRKFFLIATLLLSATAAHAGPNLTVASADVPPAASSAARPPDAGAAAAAAAAKRQAMIQQKMAMQKQKQMAMMREMQLHPIRTRVHFAVIKFKRTLEETFD